MGYRLIGLSAVFALGVALATPASAYDVNRDGFRDVWQWVYGVSGIQTNVDTDGDGMRNLDEERAGTDPWNPASVHRVSQGLLSNGVPNLTCPGIPGKFYTLRTASNLIDGVWTTVASWTGGTQTTWCPLPNPDPAILARIEVGDLDRDLDGIFDWEELALGLSATTNRSDRTSMTDSNKVRNASRGTNFVSVGVMDAESTEHWPDAAMFAIRRTGRMDRVAIPFTIGGTATPGADYAAITATQVVLDLGQREAWFSIQALADGVAEPDETVTLTILASTNYRFGASISATVTLVSATSNSLPGADEAARFLVQASFGPDTASIHRVRTLGVDPWIAEQRALPPTYHLPFMNVISNAYTNVYGSHKILGWWEQAMNAPDQLRQRVAFALSQILVISDRSDSLNNEPFSMVSYYDIFVRNAFGNYSNVLLEVTKHPAMGIYLSHMGNQPPDPSTGRFPDENYAREIMQLFSIGLWELNPDGTRKLTNGLPIPTYDNDDITAFARVFTGMSWGTGDTNLWWEFFWPETYDLTIPMRMWPQYHDTNTKVLLRGTVLPAGQRGMRDVDDAVMNLFHHPNVGPFLATRLIQRLTVSSPSTGYIARVAAIFDNNGAGVRGDLGATVRAILMDPEARDPARMDLPTHGKQREPYIRLVNLARAFNAAASNGFYEMWWVDEMVGMQPYSSPSVFNFYSPFFSPNGPLKDAGITAPEFQILTAVTGISMPNHMLTCVQDGMNRWPGDPLNTVYMDLTPLTSVASDPDAMLRVIDRMLTYGRLRPEQFRIIRDAVERIAATDPVARAELALYLVAVSPEFCIQK